MHPINPQRIRQIKSTTTNNSGPVIYWMDRERRIKDNWALLHAQNIAIEKNAPLIVIYILPETFLESALRQHDFMIKGLEEIEQDLQKLNIPFYAFVGAPATEITDLAQKLDSSYLITDFSPLKIPQTWRSEIRSKISIPFDEVDTSNIVPVWTASQKKEFAAYTLRPKIHKALPEFLTEIPKLIAHPHNFTPPKNLPAPSQTNWPEILGKLKIDHSVKPIKWLVPGEKAAHAHLKKFLTQKLKNYNTDRNDPTLDGISHLSPYLHYGMISAQRVAVEALKIDQPKIKIRHELEPESSSQIPPQLTGVAESTQSFLEELIVRRELADNFCFYEPNYDNFHGFHQWAQTTLNAHREDPRDYTYQLEEFESATTHDPLWNACQNEMLKTGKTHGYMRMYWCKKILEWTDSPETAQQIAIFLNDKYELDGRDPNGYCGIAWSIGGIHDRAWGERPVFGKIRFMNDKGCKRKFDTQKYITTHNAPASPQKSQRSLL